MARGAAIADLGAEARSAGRRWRSRPACGMPQAAGASTSCAGYRRAADAEAGEQVGRRRSAPSDQRDEEQQPPDHGLRRRQQLAEDARNAGDAAIAEPEHGRGKPDQQRRRSAAGSGVKVSMTDPLARSGDASYHPRARPSQRAAQRVRAATPRRGENSHHANAFARALPTSRCAHHRYGATQSPNGADDA